MRFWLAFCSLIIFSFLIKVVNLKGLPLYLDEGIYINWANLFAHYSSNAYASLLDGKTPFFFWLIAWLNNLFHDYLFSARFVSVIFGTLSLISWSLIVWLSTNRRTTLIFICLMLVTPYSYLIDRMAFADSTTTGLASIGLLIIFLSQKLLQQNKYILSMCSGILLGISMAFSYFAKTSAWMFVVLSSVLLLYFGFQHLKARRFMSTLSTVISLCLMLLVYRELVHFMQIGGYRYWSGITQKETQLTFSIPDIINNFRFGNGIYLQNLSYLSDYFQKYLGVFVLAAVFGIFQILQNRSKLMWLVGYTVFLTLGIYLSAKVMASRYFYPVTYPAIFLSSIAVSSLIQNPTFRSFSKILYPLLFIPIVLFIFYPLYAFYSADDQSYFVSAQTSAIGLDTSIKILTYTPDNIIGVTGIWGVREGAATLFAERHTPTVLIDQVVERYSRDRLGDCPPDQKLIGEFCYKLTLQKLQNTPNSHKFIYFIPQGEYQTIDVLSHLTPVTEITHFTRPYSNLMVYLLRLD